MNPPADEGAGELPAPDVASPPDSSDDIFPGDASLSSIDLLKRKYSFEIDLLKEQYGIRESEMTRDLQILEDRALTAEQSAEDIRSELLRIQSDLSAAKSSAHRYQTELLQSEYKYDSLLRQLFASFGCAKLDDILSVADHYRTQKAQLETLQKRLLDAQLERSATALQHAAPREDASERLRRQVRALEERLADVDVQRESDRRRFADELEAKAREARRLADDLVRADDQIRAMAAENVEIRANAPAERLQMTLYAATSLDPGQLGIQRQSALFGIFESIALILRSIGDADVDADVVARALADVANQAAAAAAKLDAAAVAKIEAAAAPGDGGAAIRRVKELEAELAELSQELDEMRQDDKAPEVFGLMMKVREQNEQIRKLTQQLAPPGDGIPPRPATRPRRVKL
jgi:hypothetical protein